MNILVITRDFPPRTNGGISTAAGYEVGGLVAVGHRCTVVSFDAWRPVADAARTDEGLTVKDDGNPVEIRLSSPAALAAATDRARDVRPDVIHLHHSTLIDFALEVSGGRVPVIKTLHVLQHHMNRFRGLEQTISGEYQKRAIAMSWRIVVMSDAARDIMIAEYPEFEEKVRVVPPGIPDRPTALAAAWPREGRIAMYAGRFSDIKGTEPLFRIARNLVTADPANSVVIAGGLPDSPASERRFLRKWKKMNQGEYRPGQGWVGAFDVSRVRFTGWLESGALDEFLTRASVYLSPSVFETFGLSAAEAMLHAVPVVATRCGGPEEFIEHGRTGLLVPPGDVDAFSRAAADLLADPGKCAAMGIAARESILSRYSPSLHTSKLVDVYHEVLS